MILEISNLTKSFGRVRALNGLNLKVDRGVTGLIGPNGSGKTTTIKISLGLLKADGGSVRVFGMDPWTQGYEIRRRLGVLHEKPSYPGELTGLELLKYKASFCGIRDAERRAREVIEAVGLKFAMDRPIKSYSAGMVQRLGLAQAIIGHPEFVILDEPTSNLDPTGRAEILDLIASLAREEDISFLISTHILSELERVCERVAVILNGRIVAEGSLQSMAEKYSLNEYTVELAEPDVLAQSLEELDFIEDLRVDEDRGRIYVKARDADALKRTIFKLALEMNLHIISIKPTYGVLEQIYRHILEC